MVGVPDLPVVHLILLPALIFFRSFIFIFIFLFLFFTFITLLFVCMYVFFYLFTYLFVYFFIHSCIHSSVYPVDHPSPPVALVYASSLFLLLLLLFVQVKDLLVGFDPHSGQPVYRIEMFCEEITHDDILHEVREGTRERRWEMGEGRGEGEGEGGLGKEEEEGEQRETVVCR